MDLSPQRMIHFCALSPLGMQPNMHAVVFTMHDLIQSPMSFSACAGTVRCVTRRRAINTAVFIEGAIGMWLIKKIAQSMEILKHACDMRGNE